MNPSIPAPEVLFLRGSATNTSPTSSLGTSSLGTAHSTLVIDATREPNGESSVAAAASGSVPAPKACEAATTRLDASRVTRPEPVRAVFDKIKTASAPARVQGSLGSQTLNSSFRQGSRVMPTGALGLSEEDAHNQQPRSKPTHWPIGLERIYQANETLLSELLAQVSRASVIGVIGIEQGCGTSVTASSVSMAVANRIGSKPRTHGGSGLIESTAQTKSRTPSLSGPHYEISGQTDSSVTAAGVVLIDANLERPSLAHDWGVAQGLTWTELVRKPQWDPGMLASVNGVKVLTSACAVHLPRPTPSGIASVGLEDLGAGADAIRYSLPIHAVGGLLQQLLQIVSVFRELGYTVVVDLGRLSFWRESQRLGQLADGIEQMILVTATPMDERAVSQAHWSLQSASFENHVIIENLGG
jgi:hypothetical protein